jgi:hypothetical protein
VGCVVALFEVCDDSIDALLAQSDAALKLSHAVFYASSALSDSEHRAQSRGGSSSGGGPSGSGADGGNSAAGAVAPEDLIRDRCALPSLGTPDRQWEWALAAADARGDT